MGSIMVYRHRPMRVVPTITTRVVIRPRAPSCVAGDIMAGGGGRQQANLSKMHPFGTFSFCNWRRGVIFAKMPSRPVIEMAVSAAKLHQAESQGANRTHWTAQGQLGKLARHSQNLVPALPKVILHLRPQHAELELSRNFLALYGHITRMLTVQGIVVQRRTLDHDIKDYIRDTEDARFNDGNLHILDDRHVQMANVLNGAPAYLKGFWHLDPQGVRCFSSIGNKSFRPDMVPYRYARKFYGRLQSDLKEQRRSRYNQTRSLAALPEGAVSVFFQGGFPKRVGATGFSDVEMLQDVLQGAGDRPVLVKPHPNVADVATMMELSDIAAGDHRVHVTDANIHDMFAASCATVSANSAVSIEGFLHRTPAILYAQADFHHFAETITGPGQFAAALERAQQRQGGYAQYMTWYFRRHCLEISAANLDQRIWEIFTAAGFPPERFAS